MNNYQAGRQAALRIVRWQAIASVVVGVLFWALQGLPAAIWAVAGGLIGTAASFIMQWFVFGKGQAMDAREISSRMFRGEAMKFVFTVAVFVSIFVLLTPLPLPLFVGYAMTFLVYWMALSRAV